MADQVEVPYVASAKPPHHDAWVLVLALAATAALSYVLSPLLSPVLWSVAVAVMFLPLYDRFTARFEGREMLASLATVAVILCAVLIPILLLSMVIAAEALDLIAALQDGRLDLVGAIDRGYAAAPSWIQDALHRFGVRDAAGLKQVMQTAIASNSKQIGSRLLAIGQGATGVAVNFALIVYLCFYLLKDGRGIAEKIDRRIPLHPAYRSYLATQFITVLRSTLKGSAAVAVAQGLVGGTAFYVLGIQSPIMWGAVMAFASLVPVVGSALVWLPIALYLLFSGQVASAVALVIVGGVIVASIDNVLRPLLVGKETGIPDYLLLLATLGGLSLFGIDGLLIGPLVVSFFLSIWSVDDADAAPEVRKAEPGGP